MDTFGTMKIEELPSFLKSLFEGERDEIANLSNASALLMAAIPDLNWAGFYRWQEGLLVLGPFQGKPACVRIAPGKGVCGTAVSRGEAIVVDDVHAFPGHIACDGASASEMVVPLHRADGSLFGVLDLDSPTVGRFREIAGALLAAAREIERILT